MLLVSKKDIEMPQKKLSQMSSQELQELAAAFFPDEKNSFFLSLDESKQRIISRLEYELVVVDLMGFNGYFIIVADFINWAKDNGIPV